MSPSSLLPNYLPHCRQSSSGSLKPLPTSNPLRLPPPPPPPTEAMLVQKDHPPSSPSKPRNRFSQSTKSLDLSACGSDNPYKLSLIVVLLLALPSAFLLLRRSPATTSLLCIESTSSASSSHSIPYPHVPWGRIPTLPPSTSPPSLNWIVITAPPHDPDSDPTLRRLARLDGWQLLAVADSLTPANWSLPGAIFLSLDRQASLGFRVLHHLPSHSRKTAAYLFAIRHGARRIFDADSRGEILHGNLSAVFDVELQEHQVLLRYSHHDANRTVVNPFVHFGQRTVWPRGMPLDQAGVLNSEEFYTETFGGKQFIQVGLSNGLPDVDAAFYFTRKTGREPFDIRFDDTAPKVALPQGTMIPVNSFNTLFHVQAFWGLLLPVSVSSMASDVIRGYWAQRILWEIGGNVAVYPPTVYRRDRSESYPFAEERDLHVNVGRLIEFLVSWRSNKPTLFERVLQLSYDMAVEGFWGELDVRLTADWLQDLLAVGYQQPRLMSLEIDLPRAVIGDGDMKEFVPKKIPSVHLGVEEIGTVSVEIANLIKWRKHFGNVVLVMYCSGDPERTALEWRLLYGRIFKTVVILSEKNDEDLAVEQVDLGQAYKYLPTIFKRFTGAEGFMFLHSNMILNYWNLVEADKTKLWIADKVSGFWNVLPMNDNNTDWIGSQGKLLKNLVSSLPIQYQTSYKESIGEENMVLCESEIFYIPRRLVPDFTDLVERIGQAQLHHKLAVPLFFMAMDSPQNFDSAALSNITYKTNLPSDSSYSSYYSSQATAVYPCKVPNEPEFIKLIRLMASGDPLLKDLI